MADRKPFLLRLDPELHKALQRWADDELRSVNGQIEFLLREAVQRSGRLKPTAPSPPEPPAPPDADADARPEAR